MTATAYVPRHAIPTDPCEGYDPTDSRDVFEVEEIVEVLRAMPLDPDALGDGSTSDWTLAVLFALAGRGDRDATDYIAPRIEAAALTILTDLGYPGDGFQGVGE